MKLKYIVRFATILSCATFYVNTQTKVNIAFGKHTVQDGVLHYPDNPDAYWVSSNAVDGKKVCPTEPTFSSYSGTAIKRQPWWQVDLGDVYSVTDVTVYGRPTEKPPQLKGFQVYMSLDNETTSESHVYNNTGAYNKGVFANVITHGTRYLARYVTLVLLKSDFSDRVADGPLVLCEVEVYGVRVSKECADGKYGLNCSSPCGKCLGTEPCNKTTGHCTIGCIVGYKGPRCDEVCDFRTFGYNCASECHCHDNTSCDAVSGECSTGLCGPGWQGSSCDKVCDYRTFGYNCSSVCHCHGDTNCNAVSGECSTGWCNPGWQGSSCDKVCDYRTFGFNCSSVCHCNGETSCNAVSGECSTGLCNPGWQGSSCDKAINVIQQLKSYVKTSMSSVANNWTADRAIDGNTGPNPDKCQCCSGTENSQVSWWMIQFREKIPLKSIKVFSRNNEIPYPSLEGFELYLSDNIISNMTAVTSSNTIMLSKIYDISLPNLLTRYIKIQRPGVLTLCEVQAYLGDCEVGKFGRECAYSCHCADNKPCDAITGICQSPFCKTGWLGSACNKKCPPDTFGDDCSEKCYCADGTCTNNYGICPGKCRSGYHGPHCNEVRSVTRTQMEGRQTTANQVTNNQTEGRQTTAKQVTNNQTEGRQTTAKRSSNTAVIGGAVGASAALIVIAVIIGIIVYRLRRINRDSGKNDYTTPNMYVSPTETPEYDTLDNINDATGAVNSVYENERVTGL